MSEPDFSETSGESPIEASLAAPPVSYDQASSLPTSKGVAAPAAASDRLIDKPWFIIVLMLHLGVLGIPAYWMTSYSLQTRVMLVVASILYTAMAVAIIVWGLLQILSVFR